MQGGRTIVFAAAVGLVALPVHAQFGALMGSSSGSYCKVKKKDVISVATTLPLDRSAEFALQMSLRRLASLARSKGFSAIRVRDKGCGTMLVNNAAQARSCTLEAHMENVGDPPSADVQGERLAVEKILADTAADARLYPVPTGLLNAGNKCVID